MGGGSIHRRDSQEFVDLAQTACQLFAHDDKILLSIDYKDCFQNEDVGLNDQFIVVCL